MSGSSAIVAPVSIEIYVCPLLASFHLFFSIYDACPSASNSSLIQRMNSSEPTAGSSSTCVHTTLHVYESGVTDAYVDSFGQIRGPPDVYWLSVEGDDATNTGTFRSVSPFCMIDLISP